MAISLKHNFTSAVADGGDTSLVQPSNWNAEHSLTLATSSLLGRTTAGTGAAEEISVGTGLNLSSGSLAVSSTTPQLNVTNTFTAAQIISVTDNTNAALRVTQTGTGNAFVVEDSATPDSTPFAIDSNGSVTTSSIVNLTGSSQTNAGAASILNMSQTWNAPTIAVTAASGNGTSVTLTHTAQAVAVPVGSTINVSGFTPTGYNTATGAVTASTTTTTTYTNATSTTVTVLGTFSVNIVTPILLNITNTSSAGTPLFMDLRVGGTSFFTVNRAGNVASGNVVANGLLQAASGSNIQWASRGILTSPAAGGVQLGATDAAAPVAQTFSAQSVVAGTTNLAGQDLTIRGSRGTGTGTGGAIALQTAPAGTTGTAQNAAVERMRITPAGDVGIGIVNPSGRLEVLGGVANSITSLGTGDAASLVVTNSDVSGLGRISKTLYEVGNLPLAAVAAVYSAFNAGGDIGGDLVFGTQTNLAGGVVERLRISKDGAFGIAGANYGTSGQFLKSAGSAAAPSWASISNADISGLGTMSTQNANSVSITGGSITGITDLAVADGGTGASTLTGYVKGSGTAALTASATIPNTDITGLGTMSTQAASSVAITGGSITGITDLAVADGGTGASDAAGARTNLAVPGTGVSNTFTANQIISVTDNTNAALRITQTGTGNALLVEDSTNPDSSPLVVNADGQLLIGNTTAQTGINALSGGVIQVIGPGGADQSISVFAEVDLATTSGSIRQHRKRTTGAVVADDRLGIQQFAGFSGTNYRTAASLYAEQDGGTISDTSMAGRLVFATTPNGSTSASERFRIGSAGQLGIGGANYGTSGQFIKSAGSAAAPSWASIANTDVSGLGTMSTQNANSVSITGGSITGITDLAVADGGTGAASFTAYSVVLGGTTSTGPLQNVSGVGTSGQVLTSAGAGAAPTWAAPTAGSGALIRAPQILTSGTSYTTPAGCTAIYVEQVGGGGGSGGINTNSDNAKSGTGGGGSGAYAAKYFSGISSSTIATTGASGTGATATITFATQASAPSVGTRVTISGVTPTGYNGTYTVTASSTTSVSYASATTGSQTVAGTIAIGSTLTYAIGAGGTAGTAGGNGGTGGSTTFTVSGTTVTAAGGVGSTGISNSTASTAGGAGGAGTNGDINVTGTGGVSGGGFGDGGVGGAGGNSFFGGGAAGTVRTTDGVTAGIAGTSGGGASGAAVETTTATESGVGAAGGAGLIRITEYT